MLRKCTKPEFEKYADFVYALALVPSKSGYPTYNDGIKTKEMFIDRAEKAFSRYTEDILLFEHNGNVEGWVHYYWIPEDKYLSTVSFNINSAAEQALQEFLNFARIEFKGYDLYLGYPTDNKNAVDFLSAHDFECIEAAYNNTAFLEKCGTAPVSDEIIPITKENYAYFRELHAQAEGDMYWNCDRIYVSLENWALFVKLMNLEPVGTVYYMKVEDGWFEIFGIDMKDGICDSDLFRELINIALTDAKKRGGKFMTFFVMEKLRRL